MFSQMVSILHHDDNDSQTHSKCKTNLIQRGIASFLSTPSPSNSHLVLSRSPDDSQQIVVVEFPHLKIPIVAQYLCGRKCMKGFHVTHFSAAWYVTRFIDPHESELIFQELEHQLPWREGVHEIDTPVGPVKAPRQSLFFGPQDQWPSRLLDLRDRLERQLGYRTSCVLANRYAHGGQHIGWHADREIPRGLIFSLSFGAVRGFGLRELHLSGKSDRWVLRKDLDPGSLVIMAGDFQQHFQHRIFRSLDPKVSLRSRINLTFRLET